MPRIRYICLSDLHLGQDNSLLTNLFSSTAGRYAPDFTSPSPVLVKLCAALQELILRDGGRHPQLTLILNGDILELALADVNEAAMVFERFVEEIMPPGRELFKKIVYIPGNHDHHLWEIAREAQYLAKLAETISLNARLEAPRHATQLFEEDRRNPFLQYFLKRLGQKSPEHLQDLEVGLAYPNYGLLNAAKDRCVIFHHGHFVERIYHLISEFMTVIFPQREHPRIVWDLEEENFAWIDFFWSTLGRSGQAGEKAELIYESLQDEETLQPLIATLAANLADRIDIPLLNEEQERKLVEWVLMKLARKLLAHEKKYTEEILSAAARNGLARYLEIFVYHQMKLTPELARLPERVTLVYGHTHKPYQDTGEFAGYPGRVQLYNTGGWVAEAKKTLPNYGAAMVFLDEELNSVSLRLYNEAERPESYQVKVASADATDSAGNAFREYMENLVAAGSDGWREFSQTVAAEVRLRKTELNPVPAKAK